MAVVALGMRGVKRYVLYVCGTQDQADDHVQNIADLLAEAGVGRDVSRYGTSKGWKRNRLRTDAGFTVDAIGLDTAARGRKLESYRPDLIVIDDVDEESDTEKTVQKKVRALTRKLLPAGSEDLAIIAVQNLVHEGSVFSQLADGAARFLSNRVVSGPIPAVEDLEYEEHEDGSVVITGGRATWEGMPLSRCQEILDDEGLEAFLVERQQLTDTPLGNLVYRRSRVDAAIKRGDEVARDPLATQVLALDPGYAKRAALLAIQERGDRVELWKEYSFTRCNDDYIAKIAARHMVSWGVTLVYYDAEDPGLASAIKKHYRKRCRERGIKPVARFQKVAFGTWKRYSIKITRWLLDGPTVAFGAEETETHLSDRFDGMEPGIFRREVRGYQIKPGTEDPEKEKDHGPDAFHAYAVRWLRVWKRRTNQKNAPDLAEPEAA